MNENGGPRPPFFLVRSSTRALVRGAPESSCARTGRCDNHEVNREHYVTRRTSLDAPDPHDERSLTAGERVELVWQLTREAWTFKDGRWNEPRLRRDVGRVIRGRR